MILIKLTIMCLTMAGIIGGIESALIAQTNTREFSFATDSSTPFRTNQEKHAHAPIWGSGSCSPERNSDFSSIVETLNNVRSNSEAPANKPLSQLFFSQTP